MDLDLHATAKQARSLLDRRRYAEAAQLYRTLCADPNTVEQAYDEWAERAGVIHWDEAQHFSVYSIRRAKQAKTKK